jgi:hypothetical protein
MKLLFYPWPHWSVQLVKTSQNGSGRSNRPNPLSLPLSLTRLSHAPSHSRDLTSPSPACPGRLWPPPLSPLVAINSPPSPLQSYLRDLSLSLSGRRSQPYPNLGFRRWWRRRAPLLSLAASGLGSTTSFFAVAWGWGRAAWMRCCPGFHGDGVRLRHRPPWACLTLVSSKCPLYLSLLSLPGLLLALLLLLIPLARIPQFLGFVLWQILGIYLF